MQDVEKQLIERAKALFAEGKVQRVVGWKKGLFEEDVTPGVFNSVEELENIVEDKDEKYTFSKSEYFESLMKILKEKRLLINKTN